jgi:urease accessory protein UreE
LIKVESAPENVLLVTAETPYALMRAAYHLGNRHIPVELGENFRRLEADPVLEEMLDISRMGKRKLFRGRPVKCLVSREQRNVRVTPGD